MTVGVQTLTPLWGENLSYTKSLRRLFSILFSILFAASLPVFLTASLAVPLPVSPTVFSDILSNHSNRLDQ